MICALVKTKLAHKRVQILYLTHLFAFSPTIYVSVDISCLRERKEKLPINVICYKGLSYLRFDKSKNQLLFKVLVLINNY